MVNIEALIEQTVFLLEKQKDAQQDCTKIFNDLLSATQVKLVQVKKEDPTEAEHLEHVYDLIAEQAERLTEEAQMDIDFLAEQLEALQKIHSIKDPVKSRELLNMLIDENEEIKDTEAFKQEVNDESAGSRQNLLTMVQDIKDAIMEGNAQDVANYLESIMAEDESDESDDDDDCTDDCTCGKNPGGKCMCSKADEGDDHHEASGGCGGCKGCGTGGGCGSGCGDDEDTDIFSNLSKYEKEFFTDPNDKITH